jgi:serine/threonine-protein kinase
LPFEAKTPMEYIQKHVVAAPIPLADRAPDRAFPEGLWETLRQAMAKAPEDRYQSAIEFALALRPFAGTHGAGLDAIFQMSPVPPSVSGAHAAVFVRNEERAPPSAPTSEPKPASGSRGHEATATAEPRRQSLGLLLGVATLFLLIGAGLAVAILSWLAE